MALPTETTYSIALSIFLRSVNVDYSLSLYAGCWLVEFLADTVLSFRVAFYSIFLVARYKVLFFNICQPQSGTSDKLICKWERKTTSITILLLLGVAIGNAVVLFGWIGFVRTFVVCSSIESMEESGEGKNVLVHSMHRMHKLNLFAPSETILDSQKTATKALERSSSKRLRRQSHTVTQSNLFVAYQWHRHWAMPHVHDNFNSIYKSNANKYASNWKTFGSIVFSISLCLFVYLFFTQQRRHQQKLAWSQWSCGSGKINKRKFVIFFSGPMAAAWPNLFSGEFFSLPVIWREKRSLTFRNVIPFGRRDSSLHAMKSWTFAM